MTSLSNANSEVYVETSVNTYSYKGSVSAGTSLNTTIGTSNAVWVLISPTSNNAYAYITTTASPYENSSSTSLSDNAIAAIVICSVVGWFIFLFIFGLIVGCHIAKNKRSKQRNNSSAQYADNRAPVVNNYMYQYKTANNGYSPYTQNGSNQYQNSAPHKGQQMDSNPSNQQDYAHGYPIQSNSAYSNGNTGVPSNKV